MAKGFSFADDPQMSVREKIDRYFQQTKTATKTATVSVLDESTSDESLANSFSGLDESFAQILNNNPHVTLIRKSKKGNETEMESSRADVTLHQNHQKRTSKPPYMPTPTRRGEIKPLLRSTDSDGPYPFLWEVSDESFLEMEQLCESPRKNDDEGFLAMEQLCELPCKIVDDFNNATLLDDVEAPSFLIHSSLDDSVFETSPASILSPMKLVGLRRPSTILEESTINSINSSEERSSASLSLKHSLNVQNKSNESDKSRSFRPSLVNVFPTRGRIGYYKNFDEESASSSAQPPVTQRLNKENSTYLMRFDTIEEVPPLSGPTTPANGNCSLNLMRFDSSVDDASFSNSSLDQTHCNSSMSDSEPPDQFNDTLEAVDYYMKQGRKIMDKTSASTVHQQVMPSPKSRNDSLLKQTLARRHFMSINCDNLNTPTCKKLF